MTVKRSVAVVLAAGIAINAALLELHAAQKALGGRLPFVLQVKEKFEEGEKRRRAIHNNSCHTDYGALTLTGSSSAIRRFLLGHIGVDDDGWFVMKRHVRPGQVRGDGWWHRHCTIFVRDIHFRRLRQSSAGATVTHIRGMKRGDGYYRPRGCQASYNKTDPVTLYVRGLVNMLNNEWSERYISSTGMRLKRPPSRALAPSTGGIAGCVPGASRWDKLKPPPKRRVYQDRTILPGDRGGNGGR